MMMMMICYPGPSLCQARPFGPGLLPYRFVAWPGCPQSALDTPGRSCGATVALKKVDGFIQRWMQPSSDDNAVQVAMKSQDMFQHSDIPIEAFIHLSIRLRVVTNWSVIQ